MTAHPGPTQETTSPTSPTPWHRVAAFVLLLTAAFSLMLVAFAWPASRSSLHGVPIALAGPEAAVTQVAAALEERQPGAFEIRQVPDEAAAIAAIKDREVYGAVVLGEGAPTVLTASAASPVIAQGLQQLGQALAEQFAAQQAQQGSPAAPTAPTVVMTKASVRDVVPAPINDQRGAGLATGALPLVIGGIVTAGLLTARVRGATRRLVGAAGVSVFAGLLMTAILQGWIGSLAGSYWANAGIVALALAATSFTLLGLEWLFGPAGLGLGSAVFMLLGNPLSGMASAPEMLPGWWGELGQLLPPGALGTALRSVAFFDGVGAVPAVAVLSCWFAAGVALCGVAALRTAGRRRVA